MDFWIWFSYILGLELLLNALAIKNELLIVHDVHQCHD